MSKYDALRSAFSGRFTRVITVLALVAAIAVPGAVTAFSATGDQEVYLRDGGPCAVFDTRSWDMDPDSTLDDGVPLGAGDTAQFLIAGTDGTDWDFYETTTTIGHQGAIKSPNADPATGNVDGCDVPDGADGVLINLNALFPTGDGNLQGAPAGASDLVAVIVYDQDVFGVSNMTSLEINPSNDSQGHLWIRNNANTSVHVRGEVVGWTCDSGACT